MQWYQNGIFKVVKKIGDTVSDGDIVANVEGEPIKVKISGIIRGMLRDGIAVTKGLNAGDVDPRGDRNYCVTISEKARTLGGCFRGNPISATTPFAELLKSFVDLLFLSINRSNLRSIS